MNRLSMWNRFLLCSAALALAYGVSQAAGPQPTGSAVTYSQPVSGRNSGGVNIPISVDDAGYVNVNASFSLTAGAVTAADGGALPVYVANTPLPVDLRPPDGGQPYVVSVGPWTLTTVCQDMTCGTVADGGATVLTAGVHYDLIVDPNAGIPIRFLNGSPPTSYAAGPGRIMSASGAILDYVPPSAPDGGTPNLYCVTPSGSTFVNLCQTNINSK
jgi:hypothetical protein